MFQINVPDVCAFLIGGVLIFEKKTYQMLFSY